jgi:branched-chain amino acid transport system ATP-binding protein
MTLLAVDGLTKRFGGLTAVDDLSFGVEHGEILGFIGPNGAGKTTTFNCVMGTHDVSSGTIRYDGADITGCGTHEIVNRGIARTFQTAQPVDEFTVAQNIGFALMEDRLFSLTRRSEALRNRVVEIAATVGFEFPDLDKEPAELPHAGLLRLELARALAVDPDLVLVDEVFAGLAAGEVDDFVTLFRRLRSEGYTFVVIDHNMRGLLELIDRAIVLNFGQKIASGTPADIRADEAVQEAYFGGERA